ncbi:anti-sigma factor [Paraburkholderia sp. 1N]|uniref:Anti-sigma factor n=1 Tax=Paraburkholderia solitsugae TaxID=2675748 RepID=A0ABX2BW81_9BURK|nr:anti-sigma factor [Paraburkholderia solitsugae]NPT45140.1 anti-sigma factor [Paraburkholderia solitsugae]
MDCNEARPLLDANADHELPAPDAQRVQQHIESCDACRRESENLRTLSASLRAQPYYRAPDALRARILAALPVGDTVAHEPIEAPRAAAQPRPKRSWLGNWLNGWLGPQGAMGRPGGVGSGAGSGAAIGQGWLVALVVALGAVAVGVTMNQHRPAQGGGFSDELVESHVRAQMSGHDIDVISTDRHTVKPWFNGRIDYSPPVEDLAANGFPLEGGRLDYIAHQRVAVLVYRYQKHIIDVYVFPEARSADAGPEAAAGLSMAQTREGYSLAHWNAQGMTWWAVTDAAPDALSGLEKALKARLAGGSEQTEGG